MRSHSDMLITSMNTQCTLASYDLHYILRDFDNQESAGVTYTIKDESDIHIWVCFPLRPASESFSATRSILQVQSVFDLVSDKMLPSYFGNHLKFIDFELTGNLLTAQFRTNSRVYDFIAHRVLPMEKLSPVRHVDELKSESLLIVENIDEIVATSSIKHSFRLPRRQKIWERVRLSESIYAFEYFSLNGKVAMIRFAASLPVFINRSVDVEGQIMQPLEDYIANEPSVIDHVIANTYNMIGRSFLEARIVVA